MLFFQLLGLSLLTAACTYTAGTLFASVLPLSPHLCPEHIIEFSKLQHAGVGGTSSAMQPAEDLIMDITDTRVAFAILRTALDWNGRRDLAAFVAHHDAPFAQLRSAILELQRTVRHLDLQTILVTADLVLDIELYQVDVASSYIPPLLRRHQPSSLFTTFARGVDTFDDALRAVSTTSQALQDLALSLVLSHDDVHFVTTSTNATLFGLGDSDVYAVICDLVTAPGPDISFMGFETQITVLAWPAVLRLCLELSQRITYLSHGYFAEIAELRRRARDITCSASPGSSSSLLGSEAVLEFMRSGRLEDVLVKWCNLQAFYD
ncbi:hypothetical protein PENSPDRAFT_693794 [Peniophora sp. CONT]|nr:hypothetical protein PENSPDRAFT_693794 [Peniophora sp. CONT]